MMTMDNDDDTDATREEQNDPYRPCSINAGDTKITTV